MSHPLSSRTGLARLLDLLLCLGVVLMWHWLMRAALRLGASANACFPPREVVCIAPGESWRDVPSDTVIQPCVVKAGIDEIAVGILLQAGADPCVRDNHGWTALHTAAVVGNILAVTLLLRAGADRLVRADSGDTPWDMAVRYGHHHLQELLAPGSPGLGAGQR